MAASETREAVIALSVDGRPVIERFEAVERLSELFAISVSVYCNEVVDFLPHLGAPANITIRVAGEKIRVFNGLLFEADYVDESPGGHRYHLVLRPWLYKLTRNLDYAIYQNQSALDIIKAVFQNRGYSDIDYSKLSGSFSPREYCVQYRESDFTFVSRLMEEEGIYYFFRHEQDKHTLVLCNARNSHAESAYPNLPFIAHRGAAQHFQEHVSVWNERVATGHESKVSVYSWDFKQPDAPRKGDYSGGPDAIDFDTGEVFDYPAAFIADADGKARAQMMLEAARGERRLYHGEVDAPALACGDLVKIAKHPIGRFNQEYLVVGLRYHQESQQYASGGAGSGPTTLMVIEAVPADIPWRAPMATPRPVARGPESAVVTGPSGEVIYTDEFGRVKVRFHWDRGTSPPEQSSCFIRVSHNSAGAGFGNVILPRVGQEVIVDFLNGDPDRPIITGRVYNANRKHTYGLPDNKTRSLWRSQTVGDVGGDYDNAESPPSSGEIGRNEIRMEDASGKEELYYYAQRDVTTTTRRDHTYTLGRSYTGRIGYNRTVNIKNNESKTVEEGDETHTVSKGKRTTEIQQNETLTVKMGDMSTTVSQGNKSIKVSMGNMTTGISMGNYSLKTDMGSVTIEAMQSITLKVGGNSVVVDQMGVHVKGMMVDIKADIQLDAQGLLTNVKADALTVVKGGIVMIN